jgi:PKD repeat protein
MATPWAVRARALSVTNASAAPGSTNVAVSIDIDYAGGLVGARFVLAYDTSAVILRDVATTPLTADFSLVSNTSVDGRVTIVLARGTAIITGPDAMVTVTFDVRDSASPGAYPLVLVEARIEDGEQALPLNLITSGTFTVYGPPPVAGFAGLPTSGTAPLMVRFVDTSTNDPTSWSWDFGDGASSSHQNPVHSYESAGQYTVSLTVTHAGGSDEETQDAYIQVHAEPPAVVPIGTITTVAGDGFKDGVLGSGRFFGDGRLATTASLNAPSCVFTDIAGHVYVSDSQNHRVRKVDASTGVISTVAGNGSGGFSGDGGPATEASLSYPGGIFLDGGGHLYIADTNNHRVRRVDAGTGAITTVAGDGVFGFTGDGGPATLARLRLPTGICVGSEGGLYIADRLNHRVRRVDGVTGTITTVAGSGTGDYGAGDYGGDAGPATEAGLHEPVDVFLSPGGDLYIADRLNHRVRQVDGTTGTIATVAGSGGTGPDAGGFSGDNGQATEATLTEPEGLFVDGGGNLYVADALNRRIRKVDTSGTITTVAGYGDVGHTGDGGVATLASLGTPCAFFVTPTGDAYVADRLDHRVRHIRGIGEPTVLQPGIFAPPTDPVSPLVIATVAGGGGERYGGDGAPATLASLNSPAGIFIGGKGNLYIADADNHRVRMVDASGTVATVAGDGYTTAPFGLGRYGGDGGYATLASLEFPTACAVDSTGDIYIVDTGNHRIQKVDAQTRTITTVVGDGFEDDDGEGRFAGDLRPATQASLNSPTQGIFLDPAGNLYISDTANHRVRRVDVATGVIATIAGDGFADEDGKGRFSGDGGPAARASLFFPNGIFVDQEHDLYIADSYNHRIRKVDGTTGVISTIAGDGFADDDGVGRFGGDSGPATLASLNDPCHVFVDASGDVYIADQDNHRLRVVEAATGIMRTVAGTGREGGFGHGRFGGDGGSATNATLWFPTGVSVDASGTLYITDMGNDRIRTIEGLAAPTRLVVGVYEPAGSAQITKTPDFTGDGRVNFADFVEFAQNFGKRETDLGYDPRYDLNDNGSIGFGDFVLFAQNFGKPVTSATSLVTGPP